MVKDLISPQTLFLVISFSAWAFLHTLLATLKIKNRVLDRTKPFWHRWYRLIYIIIAVMTIAPVVYLIIRYPGSILYSVPPPWRWVLRGIQILGAAGMTWTMFLIDLPVFAGLKKESRLRRDKSPVPLVVKGPFRWMRHPIYTFTIIVIWAQPEMRTRFVILFTLMTLYMILGSLHEETVLLSEFGKDYAEYKKRTGRFLPVKNLFVK